jgi:hypothetical protein
MAHLDPILRKRPFPDATLRLEDGSLLEVHKCLLACHSELFRKLFYYNYNKDKPLPLNSISHHGFANILNWIYEVLFSGPCLNFIPCAAIKSK